VVNKIK